MTLGTAVGILQTTFALDTDTVRVPIFEHCKSYGVKCGRLTRSLAKTGASLGISSLVGPPP